MDVRYLESIAQQLVARVRDDDPEANQRWLHNVTTPADREALLYVLAAAVPETPTWQALTAWTRTSEELAQQQAMRRQALINATTRRRRREAA